MARSAPNLHDRSASVADEAPDDRLDAVVAVVLVAVVVSLRHRIVIDMIHSRGSAWRLVLRCDARARRAGSPMRRIELHFRTSGLRLTTTCASFEARSKG